MKHTNSEHNHNKENKKHTFEMHNKKHSKKAAQDDIMEDLEFISEESVKDKSRMAEGKPIANEFVSKKKTLRRSVDQMEANLCDRDRRKEHEGKEGGGREESDVVHAGI